jgi:ribosomal protein S14
VEIYGRVRRAVRVEGRSQRAVAREFGLSRETVRKMLEYAVPPGYQRQQPIKRPKLGPWLGVIDAILGDDKLRPAKQRHTAKRIFDRLRDEHGFTGGYTIVKDYVRGEQVRSREMFVPLKGYVHEVVIACASEVIARHRRSYEREAVVFDPLHYLALLEQKTRALDQAAPLAGWQLPACYLQLRRLLEARLKKHGSREYVQVLRLLETFDLSELTLAIEDALRLGTISFDAVRHLLLCRIERRPPRLDMQNYPHLPLAQVRTTQATDYMSLLVAVGA